VSIRIATARAGRLRPLSIARFHVGESERDDSGAISAIHERCSGAPGGTITVFVVKDDSLAREALLAVLGGRPADVRVFGSPEVDEARVPEHARMTRREMEVTDLIGAGLSNKEIAERLNITSHTVKSHVRNVMVKLALHTRLQIAAHSYHERIM
jgi:DNA-binding CsgD family transcriptional regulator